MPPTAAARRSGRRKVKEEPPSDTDRPQENVPQPNLAVQDVELHDEQTESNSAPLLDPSTETSEAATAATASTAPDSNLIQQSSPAPFKTPLLNSAKPSPKFKPKAGRRSKEERDAAEKAEAERRRQKADEAGVSRGLSHTGPSPRGRGGPVGSARGGVGHKFTPLNQNARQLDQQASGPFGGGPWAIRPTPRTRGGKAHAISRAQTTTSSDTTAAKKEAADGNAVGKTPKQKRTGSSADQPNTARTNARLGITEVIYLSSDDDKFGGQRVNIEQINLVSSEEEDSDLDEDPIRGSGKRGAKQFRESSAALRPVRVERHEHISRAAGLAAKPRRSGSTESKPKTHKLGADIEMEGEAGRESDVEVVRAETTPQTVRGKRRQSDIAVKDEPHDEETAGETRGAQSARTKPKHGRKVGFQHLDAAETVEEREEQERHDEGIESLKEELAYIATQPGATGGSAEAEEHDLANAVNNRTGKLYLFQFPPVTPMLYHPDEDIIPLDADEPAKATANAANGPDKLASSASVAIKKEEGSTKPMPDTRALTAVGSSLPAGHAGKLKVHKSGRVTMEWGGVDMEVHWGSEVDFLQDAVLITPPGQSDWDKAAWSLSQVTKKMVVTPDWEKMFE